MKLTLPKDVQGIIKVLTKAGFEAFAVGGCVRDMILGREVKDWDITTNAKPEEIQKLFKKSFYENAFGTVGVLVGKETYEITTYRIEEKYTDRRHPDVVQFTDSLEKDLARRDFTINAIAFDGKKLIDPFDGQRDIERKLIKAVGNPQDRFSEDALRMLRAIRFACQLDFAIDPETFQAIRRLAGSLMFIAKERIRDEFIKMLASFDPAKAINLLKEADLLFKIIPELEGTLGVIQTGHHIYPVFEHLLLALKFCPSSDPIVRLATFFHDIGKPATKDIKGDKVTFYSHDKVGAKITEVIMRRLHFSNDDIKKAVNLVAHHMFYYNPEVTDAAVRRFIKRVGKENIADLIELRIGDRLGSGVPKGKTRKLYELEQRIEEVSKDPISTSQLAIDGHEVMKEFTIEPGPLIGKILNALLEMVIEDPELNTKKALMERAKKLYGEFTSSSSSS